MNLKEIQQLIKLVESSEISELEVEEKDKKIRISKNNTNVSASPVIQSPVPAVSAASVPISSGESASAALKKSDKIVEVKSPMVGTFYRAASPDSDPYTDVGKMVKAGDVLCIVEAMKLMNEIESEYTGKVVEILVENAQPVEYNQVLFLIEKS